MVMTMVLVVQMAQVFVPWNRVPVVIQNAFVVLSCRACEGVSLNHLQTRFPRNWEGACSWAWLLPFRERISDAAPTVEQSDYQFALAVNDSDSVTLQHKGLNCKPEP